MLLSILKKILIFILLTILTQTGGFIYLLYSIVKVQLQQKRIFKHYSVRMLLYLFLYVVINWLIVPPIAKKMGRVKLALQETENLIANNFLGGFLNRDYVSVDLFHTLRNTSDNLNTKYPDFKVVYLDACFPFFNGFPLLPHWSHNDGKKIDLAFCYRHADNNKPANKSPSIYGYGICEEANPSEFNQAELCRSKGYYQYSILKFITPQFTKNKFKVDYKVTSDLLSSLSLQPKIQKIFIEKHLLNRMNLIGNKFRFHGCHSVRHDDHIHIQVH